ncbi:hypothetical protein [Streptomyces griseiscabiei]|uniref:Uncharacterized protein n=1 Tax=Streptomyces griseiscabiei TaxID=2993540 RepID=A0ABU4LDM7_9ACTN|nr:hypothetical protein [Streptomyces griseiscabiei]MBZ3907318.1 hypothetical protein [Streptomyces griseiscabiei]MDX2913410.1 hypothetical protein [Streptomyces griseiscabiei]
MSTTVQRFPASLGEVLADADATATTLDATRIRAGITVGQALEAEEREAVRRSVDAQFPIVAAFLAEESAKCPEWCLRSLETEPHPDHVSASVAVSAPGEAAPYLDARLLHLAGEGQPFIGLAGARLTPLQARVEAKKLRALAGSLEGLAGYLDATAVVERASSRVLGLEEPGHYAWCAPGKCFERSWKSGETLLEHQSAEVVLRSPLGTSSAPGALISACLYADSDYAVPGLSFDSGAEGVALAPEPVGEVIADFEAFLEGLRALHGQMGQEEPPAGPGGSCSGLGGTCVTDHTVPPRLPEDLHCDGPRVTMAGDLGEEFPDVYLSQWVGEAPRVVVDGSRQDLDLHGLDEMLSNLHAYEVRLRAMREQLAALEGGAR